MALDNPLALSLVRDTCASEDDARELLAFSAAQHHLPAGRAVEIITDYLLDRVLPAAYTCQPGQTAPPYDLATARDALAKIAAQMNRQVTRDLYWWHIPDWAPRRQRKIMSAAAAGIVAGIGCGFGFGPGLGLGSGLTTGFMGGLMGGLAGGLVGWFADGLQAGQPPRMAIKLQVMKIFHWKPLLSGVAMGFTFWLGIESESGPVSGLAAGLAIGLAVWLSFGLIDAVKGDRDSESSRGPATSWRLNWNYAFLMMLAIGLAIGLSAGITGAVAGELHIQAGGGAHGRAHHRARVRARGRTRGIRDLAGTPSVGPASAQVAHSRATDEIP